MLRLVIRAERFGAVHITRKVHPISVSTDAGDALVTAVLGMLSDRFIRSAYMIDQSGKITAVQGGLLYERASAVFQQIIRFGSQELSLLLSYVPEEEAAEDMRVRREIERAIRILKNRMQ